MGSGDEPAHEEGQLTKSPFFRKYLLPGFVFQSVVIAGGYGTGRELAEFFLTEGPLGGLLAMLLVSMVLWSAVCVATFAFARTFESYDYRSLFKRLLGRAWILYELTYLAMLFLILAVIAAAAGTILEETFGLPYAVGVIGIMAAVGFLTFRGTTVIEWFLARWSLVLYVVYIVFFVWCFARFGGDIVSSFSADGLGFGWITGGIRYAAYNLAVIPPILFVVRHAETTDDAVKAGILAGPIAIFPGLLFYLAMVGHYPQILERPVPANFLLEILGSRAFQLAFQVVLFGTLIETGTGLIHGVNERISGVYKERNIAMPAFLRPAVAIGLLIIGALLARFGIIDLIARGYGTMSWFFAVLYGVPILTVGVWMVAVRRRKRSVTAVG
ncbi:MAG: hypothetical protein GTO22_05875 [Gemmatimonadales bacterium]|nr:hypothetical protein [Gemmatimonadales bacterium]